VASARAQMLLNRTPDVDYDVDHWHGALFMTRRTSDTPNSEVAIAPLNDPGAARTLLPHRPDVKIEDTCVKEGYLAVVERSAEKGLQECVVYKLPASRDPEEARHQHTLC
jgi:protease II